MKSNPGTTPFPNLLLDTSMPILRDTEWRVLCVVVRQTLGWETAGGRRKAQDWLSHRQLRIRTGRHSEAVSRAVQALVDQRLIAVKDRAGNLLPIQEARMRHRARLYFSLDPEVTAQVDLFSISETRKAKATKANHTKKNLINRKLTNEQGFRINSGWERAIDLFELPGSESNK